MAKQYAFWKVVPHIYILGAGASRAAFPKGDKFGKKFPLMDDFIEVLNLENLFKKYNIPYQGKSIEEVYDDIFSINPESPIIQDLNSEIYNYFSRFEIPEHVTLYDEIILSLQEKDMIFSFNWDPLLLQAFIRNIDIGQLPKIHFLHGNVFVGYCLEHKRSGYKGNTCSICGKIFKPAQLLYPVRSKNYLDDPFIASEWKSLTNYLDKSFIMTILGYSAPRSDILAKEMMLKAWQQNERNMFNEIEIIDIKDKRNVKKNWEPFLFKSHFTIFDDVRNALSFRHVRRSTEAWGDAILMCDPWSDRKMPRFKNLKNLQEWIKPLVHEEIDFLKNDVLIPKYKIAR
jgi:hypothetical protein